MIEEHFCEECVVGGKVGPMLMHCPKCTQKMEYNDETDEWFCACGKRWRISEGL